MQLFSGAISVEEAVKTCGSDVAAEYVVVQADAVGSVIQLFKDVTSVDIDVQVEPSHFAPSIFGNVVDAA